MIVDLHTQIWTNPEQLGADAAVRLRSRETSAGTPIDATPAGHERAMDCVDAAVIVGFRSDHLGARIPNEVVAEYIGRDPGRRVGIAGIDPLAPDALNEIDSAMGLGLTGVAVSPACQNFHPAHSDAMRVYERCSALALPVFVTMQEPMTAASSLEFGRPAAWEEVARALPDLPIVIGQMGYPWIDEALALLGKHERVFADISGVTSRPWQLYNALLSASSMQVMDKLLFGSGFPYETPARAIELLYTVNAYSHGTQLPSIARSSIRAIVERNSLACLGLESEIITRIDPQETPFDMPAIESISPSADGSEDVETPAASDR